ncbi:MAG: activator of (R)-2-hydroxyglutaryl-CoA dehydratase [Acidobacteria bacterium]|nr:MAG: activator of (R)-2-hydroxyglutaryl-CoA dehydratase [Acidobacteriota bacterium]
MKRIEHYRRLQEPPFNSSEREHVTIILGGLTWKHERLIKAVLNRSGYLAEYLPQADREAHEIGKEYCASGLCNPAYFVAGNLIKRLRQLEAEGLSREEIVKNYVYFTAGTTGPCRYGMYEDEIRSALHAAGFSGFRIILFLQEHGVKASSGHSGMQFSVDFGLSALHAVVLGDLLNDLQRKLGAYEVVPGDADRMIVALVDELVEYFRTTPHFDLAEQAPRWLRGWLQRHRSHASFRVLNTLCKIHVHLNGSALLTELRKCRQILSTMEVDRLRLRPLVKIIGEFWAQLTEGDGNFRMFEFLQREGAEVAVEPISCWLLYLLFLAKQRLDLQLRLAGQEHPWSKPMEAFRIRAKIVWKRGLFSATEYIYKRHYKRLASALGDITTPLSPQKKLAALAAPHYSTFLRGGEGHLEVGKNIYYTASRKCHMVLALKPFGCLPSTQSDAVQASLVERNPEMIFASIETAGDGEIHAYSRVQMALADAKESARQEFETVLRSSQLTIEQIREFLAEQPELRSASYRVSRRDGVISTSANFLLDVREKMQSERTARDTFSVRQRSSSGLRIPTISSQENDHV